MSYKEYLDIARAFNKKYKKLLNEYGSIKIKWETIQKEFNMWDSDFAKFKYCLFDVNNSWEIQYAGREKYFFIRNIHEDRLGWIYTILCVVSLFVCVATALAGVYGMSLIFVVPFLYFAYKMLKEIENYTQCLLREEI